jgi:DNA repair exonuclease SbcCD ATPase subunit
MRRAVALSGLLMLLGLMTGAVAQSDDGALRDRLRQVTLQLRQVQDDQATIQAQKASAEAERDLLKKQLAAAQAELARVRHNGDKVAVVEAELAKSKDSLTQAAAQATDAAHQTQAEHEKLQTAVTNARTVIEACQAKNVKLLKVGRDILAAYSDFNVIDMVGANEPFTRLKRVELENLAQDYSDRIDDGMFDVRQVHIPAAPADAGRKAAAPVDAEQKTAPPSDAKGH